MSFDPTKLKIHPLIYELREELKLQDHAEYTNDYWFCLKPEKRMRYMQKHKIYLENHNESPKKQSSEIVNDTSTPGYARKTGEPYKINKRSPINMRKRIKKTISNRKITKSLNVSQPKKGGKRKNFIYKSRKKHQINAKNAKRFIIEIDD